jgi:hypothetical protein
MSSLNRASACSTFTDARAFASLRSRYSRMAHGTRHGRMESSASTSSFGGGLGIGAILGPVGGCSRS